MTGIFAGWLELDWFWGMLTGGNPAMFLVWTAVVFSVGVAIGRRWSIKKHGKKIVDELSKLPGFERVNSVDRLIDKAEDLSKRPTTEQFAELKGRVDALERSLKVAEANATAALAERGESLEDVKFAQELLDLLSKAASAENIARIADEKINNAGDAENLRYGKALSDLARYGCLSYVTCLMATPAMRYIAHVSERAEVVKTELPSFAERERIDLMRNVEEMVDKKIERQSRRCFGR